MQHSACHLPFSSVDACKLLEHSSIGPRVNVSVAMYLFWYPVVLVPHWEKILHFFLSLPPPHFTGQKMAVQSNKEGQHLPVRAPSHVNPSWLPFLSVTETWILTCKLDWAVGKNNSASLLPSGVYMQIPPLHQHKPNQKRNLTSLAFTIAS